MKPKDQIIPCKVSEETSSKIEEYVLALKDHAHLIGNLGLSKEEFWDSGIFRSAIEKIRGTQAASTEEKKSFMRDVLNFLKVEKKIQDWNFVGASERHDYEVNHFSGRTTVIESKGCLDGNNTNIFERPPNADEFVIWSLCQNPGSNPRHNAWSGIHTRLSTEIIHKQQPVDGLIIWDMLCGTLGRICPKLALSKNRSTLVSGRELPPPCLYLFPRTIPNPRNNKDPKPWKVEEVEFMKILFDSFKCDPKDVMSVGIEVRMKDANIQRKTKYSRGIEKCGESKWTSINRAK